MVWDGKRKEWLFSVIDVIEALTGSSNPSRYWSDLKRKTSVGNTAKRYGKIVRFKLKAKNGKFYMTDTANTKRLLYIIKAVPAPKTAPVKLWLESVGNNIEMLPEPLVPLIRRNPENRMLCKNKEQTLTRIYRMFATKENIPDKVAAEIIEINIPRVPSGFYLSVYFSGFANTICSARASPLYMAAV
jgi:hypothetical protein